MSGPVAGRSAAPARGAAAAVLVTAVLMTACLAASPLHAQSAGPGDLDAVAAAADSGELERARRMLERWRAERASSAGLDQLRRSSFLAARLSEHADSARALYARLAVEDDGELGARARIRLAQLHLASGEPDPALRQLELVRADFPGHALAMESWLWSGRARLAAGDTAAACAALRRAARGGSGLADRAARASSGCGLGPPSDSVRIAGAGGSEAGQEREAAQGWAVQLGAFSDRASAVQLLRRARDGGWDARRVPPWSEAGLHRVRVGRWDDRSTAEEAARALQEAGFRVLVVRTRSTDSSS